jgi:NADPH2:quinone reductase
MTHAIVVEAYGGPEVLVLRDREPPAPGPGELLVDVSASGVNFVDVYHRLGRYPNPLPFTPGAEGAGMVSAVGADVADLQPGDRVGWAVGTGSYAEQAVVAAERAVPLPDDVDDETAAAVLLQGMTAHYLVHDSYRVRPGDTVLVHAAAGGMGLLLTELVKHLGAKVVGTASSPEKRQLARDAGADLVVGYDDVPDAAKEFTGGVGVAAVYDGVGRDTFDASLASLRVRGSFVSYGSASGPVPPVDPLHLSAAGSVFFSRPTLAHFVADRAELLARARDVFGWVASGALTVRVSHRYPLGEAAQAHRDLEARRTTGKLLLLP